MKPQTYDISRIKSMLPSLSEMFNRDGRTLRKMGSTQFAPCPVHEEKTPSCQVDDRTGRFHCFGCGAGGDIFDYWQRTRELSFQDALAQLAFLAGVGPQTSSSPLTAPKLAPAPAPEKIEPLAGAGLQRWQDACDRLLGSEAEIQRIASWRGISADCVRWAARQGLFGIYVWWDLPREAFLVEMPVEDGRIPVSVHIRLAPGTKGNPEKKQIWNFNPKKCGSWPFVVGDPATADYIFVLEGQWDALALISTMGWYAREKWPRIAVFGIRGASGGNKLLAHTLNPKAKVFAVADSDGAGASWFQNKGDIITIQDKLTGRPREIEVREDGLLTKLHDRVRDVIAFWPTETKQDLNDLVKSGELDRETMLHYIMPHMPLRKGRGLTFRAWCEKHQYHPEFSTAAQYVLADTGKPKGRRPLKDWERHWTKSRVPSDLYTDLCLAWQRHVDERDLTEEQPSLIPTP